MILWNSSFVYVKPALVKLHEIPAWCSTVGVSSFSGPAFWPPLRVLYSSETAALLSAVAPEPIEVYATHGQPLHGWICIVSAAVLNKPLI